MQHLRRLAPTLLLASGMATANHFDEDGVRYVNPGVPGGSAIGSSIAIAPDGGFFVAGVETGANSNDPRTYHLRRFDRDGSDDPGFAPVSLQGSSNLRVPTRSLLLQPDGKVIALLNESNPLSPSDSYALIRRYNANGSPDASFTTFTFDPSLGADSLNALALQADGRIVAAGSMWMEVPGTEHAAVALRLMPDGTLDTSFGDEGLIREGGHQGPFSYLSGARFHSINLLSDGRIFLAGTLMHSYLADSSMLFTRVMPDGTRDPAFNQGERVVYSHASGSSTALQSRAYASDVADDGTILIGGMVAQSSSTSCVFQFHPDAAEPRDAWGRLRPQEGFCNNMGLTDHIADVQLLPNGGVVAVGSHDAAATYLSCMQGLRYCAYFDAAFEDAEYGHAYDAVAYDPWEHRMLIVGSGTRNYMGLVRRHWLLVSDPIAGSIDTQPDPVSFAPRVGAAGEPVSSAPVTLQGFTGWTRLPVRVTGGEFLADLQSVTSPASGETQLGFVTSFELPDGHLQAQLSHVAADTLGQTRSTQVQIGGVVRSTNLALTVGPVIDAGFTSTAGAAGSDLFRDGFEAD